LRRDDVIILDKLSHACLIDGAKLSGAVVRVFPHNHLGKLESHLRWARENYPDARIVVVTESVFSMDGDWALLPEIITLKNRFGALLLLDEAHALGSSASWPRLGSISRPRQPRGHSNGDAKQGTRLFRRLYLRIASPHRTPGEPRPQLHLFDCTLACTRCAAHAAIEFLDSAAGERRRQTLRRNLGQFAEEMPAIFGDGKKVQSAIIPVVLGTATAALEAAQTLMEKGYFVPRSVTRLSRRTLPACG
jgi:7-keto-8-aminopelargonate synthetase-like enzyme